MPQQRHSDRGSQYTNHPYLALLEQVGVQTSMRSVGRFYDNVMKESFWATLKTELCGLRRCDSLGGAAYDL